MMIGNYDKTALFALAAMGGMASNYSGSTFPNNKPISMINDYEAKFGIYVDFGGNGKTNWGKGRGKKYKSKKRMSKKSKRANRK